MLFYWNLFRICTNMAVESTAAFLCSNFIFRQDIRKVSMTDLSNVPLADDLPLCGEHQGGVDLGWIVFQLEFNWYSLWEASFVISKRMKVMIVMLFSVGMSNQSCLISVLFVVGLLGRVRSTMTITK